MDGAGVCSVRVRTLQALACPQPHVNRLTDTLRLTGQSPLRGISSSEPSN